MPLARWSVEAQAPTFVKYDQSDSHSFLAGLIDRKNRIKPRRSCPRRGFRDHRQESGGDQRQQLRRSGAISEGRQRGGLHPGGAVCGGGRARPAGDPVLQRHPERRPPDSVAR